MPTIKGILSFPSIFTPSIAKGATVAKYNGVLLLPPNDPQVATLQADVAQAKLETFPSGYTGQDECLTAYDVKYAGKDYYDPRFTGWWVFSFTAQADDKPAVVDMAHQPIVNPGDVHSGIVVYVSAGISGYVKGKGGVGGWLNGVMSTGEVDPNYGRLDNKPSVEQMFAGVGAGQQAAPMPSNVAPKPPVPPQQAPPQPQYVMTAKAAGWTRDALIATGDWTDETLISQGLMQPPGGVQPSFA